MDLQEMLEAISTIGTSEDETERRGLLASLSIEIENLHTNNAALTSQNEALSNANKDLKEKNMDLFLQIGAPKSNQQRLKDNTGLEQQQEAKPLKYEDLFDEKGALK